MNRAMLRKQLEIARTRHEESAHVVDAFKVQLRKRIEHGRGESAIQEVRDQLAAAEDKEVLDWQEWNMRREQLADQGIRLGVAR